MLMKSILFTLTVFFAKVAPFGITVGELPTEIAEEFKEIPQIWTQDTLLRCSHRIKPEVKLFLYNFFNRDNPIEFKPGKTNIKEKKLIILIHGWLTTYNTSKIQDLKNAYLKKYDCNVLMIDWSAAAMNPYKTSYCNIGAVSQFLSKLLCYLSKETDLKLNEIHVIGHSTGSHVAGLTGQFVLNKCKERIGRITALDPPDVLGSVKLTKTSAQYVDVIHTDIERFGTKKNYGHAEYYVNCGWHQPGCKKIAKIANNDSLVDVMCSHMRSVELMTESVNSPNSVAVSCGLCPRYCRPDILTENYKTMGEHASPPSQLRNNIFLLPTGESPPYFRGWSVYTM